MNWLIKYLKKFMSEDKEPFVYPELHRLPDDYDGEATVVTHDGYTCLEEYTVCINGTYYCVNNDDHLYVWDEIDDEYITYDDSIEAIYDNNGNVRITHINNTICIENTYYLKNKLGYLDCIVQLHNGDWALRDNCYYSERYEEWYDDNDDSGRDDDDDDDDDSVLFDYHSNNIQDFSNGSKFKIGFEIEKSQMPNFYFDKHDILNDTGFVLERDGSVDNGFELISPILDLYDQGILSHFEKVRGFIDIPYVENAGGHINVSIKGKSSEDTLLSLTGWLPLIYALYKGRANGSYSIAKKVNKLLVDTDKYQSVRTKPNDVVEFRIISAVKSFDQLEFRIALFQIIFENLGISFLEVLTLLTNHKHKLNILLTKSVYKDVEKYHTLISTAIKFERDLEGIYTVGQIEKATKKLKGFNKKIKEVCV